MWMSALLGVAIGTVMGLTGAGGGIFAVPALVMVLGMEQSTAGSIALLAVGAAALLGAVQGLRQGVVRYKAAMLLAVMGSVSAPPGLYLAQLLSPQWLSLLFATVMLLVAARMWHSAKKPTELEISSTSKVCAISPDTGRFLWNIRTFLALSLVGLIAGLFTGMLGVGGGFIIVPALAYLSNLRMQSIVATSLLVIALLCAVTVGMAFSKGLQITPSIASFVVAAMVGMLVGRSLSSRIPQAKLQQVFAVACVAVAGLMAARFFN
ncbi:sulfite exporter TauE/SafE family protein [Comamonas testosteroni]|uniref:Probable membrane transporter protein n=2 Tax=Comamonas testosteroni TaxID=285 RepID=B7WXF0_COMTK|nr:protein of unknown function DUF81 [Comamonas testosteroni KF-1]